MLVHSEQMNHKRWDFDSDENVWGLYASGFMSCGEPEKIRRQVLVFLSWSNPNIYILTTLIFLWKNSRHFRNSDDSFLPFSGL
jgi:hypothetical protein